jgi:hypothetical protein
VGSGHVQEKKYVVLIENFEGGGVGFLGDLRMDGRIILKLFFKTGV